MDLNQARINKPTDQLGALEDISLELRTPEQTQEILRLTERIHKLQDENLVIRRTFISLQGNTDFQNRNRRLISEFPPDEMVTNSQPKRKSRRTQEVVLPEGIIDRWNHLVSVSFLQFFFLSFHPDDATFRRMNNNKWLMLKPDSMLRTSVLNLALTDAKKQNKTTIVIFGTTSW